MVRLDRVARMRANERVILRALLERGTIEGAAEATGYSHSYIRKQSCLLRAMLGIRGMPLDRALDAIWREIRGQAEKYPEYAQINA